LRQVLIKGKRNSRLRCDFFPSTAAADRVVCVKSCKLIMGSGKAIPAEPPSLFHKH